MLSSKLNTYNKNNTYVYYTPITVVFTVDFERCRGSDGVNGGAGLALINSVVLKLGVNHVQTHVPLAYTLKQHGTLVGGVKVYIEIII